MIFDSCLLFLIIVSLLSLQRQNNNTRCHGEVDIKEVIDNDESISVITNHRHDKEQQQQHHQSSLQYHLDYYLQPCEIYMDSIIRVGFQILHQEEKKFRKRRLHHYSSINSNSSNSEDEQQIELNHYMMYESLWHDTFRHCYYSNTNHNTNNKSANTDNDMISITLTFNGYKGGKIHEQTNQDRSFIVKYNHNNNHIIISGVLDGHADSGHYIAELSRYQLIQQIMKYYQTQNQSHHSNDNNMEQLLKNILINIDSQLPDDLSYDGGATVSFVIQEQNNNNEDNVNNNTNLYFVNAGDSQSFLMASIVPNSNNDNNDVNNAKFIVYYETRLDKPNIPEERERIEKIIDMEVKDSNNDDEARIWYVSKKYNNQYYGLAMSRGLGDKECTGVIPEPIVKIFNKNDIIHDIKTQIYSNEIIMPSSTECIVNDDITSAAGTCRPSLDSHYNIQLYIVSATDGIIDYYNPQQIANMIGPSLLKQQQNNNYHPILLATEDILYQSSAQWYTDMKGQYRDDMAIAITSVL